MSKVDQLKAELESLSSEEFAEIFRWMSEKDWERWNNKIETDSQSGRLDFLVRDARERKAKGAPKDR
jgi:wyosine [tRNA(Phe)-imidazoG37] synthetase (radical SAM superfamily)